MRNYKVDCIKDVFESTTKQPNKPMFLKEMNINRNISEHAFNYLMNILLHQWMVHEFDPECKRDHVTNNIVEATSEWVKAAKKFPMLLMVKPLGNR